MNLAGLLGALLPVFYMLGAFAAFVCAPDERINQMPYFLDTGGWWHMASSQLVRAILPRSVLLTALTVRTSDEPRPCERSTTPRGECKISR
jgi:hypothetical protein